jgi:Competence protein
VSGTTNSQTCSVSTSITPATALIAPAICGETLKRPGSFISTSVSRSSIKTKHTSPSAPPASLAAAALVAAAFYPLLSGAEVATQRSFFTTVVVLIAVMVDRRAITFRTLAVAP